MASSLPSELWCIILDYIPRSDQVQVSQVSAHLCALAQKAIYHSVKLQSNNPAVHATLALLTRDHSLARSVKQLLIYTAREAVNGRPWLDPGVLTGMTRLSYLDMNGCPFRTKEAQEKFNKLVATSLPMLTKLELTYFSRPDSLAAEGHVPGFHTRRLEEITWKSPMFARPSPLLPLLTASCSSLIHLHLPRVTYNTSAASSLKKFFALRFPHLSTFHFSGWLNTLSLDTLLTTFLLAHPLIEDLHLWFHYSRSSCHISPDITLGPHALPRLRHLLADEYNLALLARGGLRSLRTLECLHTGTHFTANGFAEMCRALEASGGLPGVRVLVLDLYHKWEVSMWIEWLGHLCPGVEQFWGNPIVGCVVAHRRISFLSYRNVKLQVLSDDLISELSEQDRTDAVRQYALRIPSVRELQLYSDEDGGLVSPFIIERDGSGEIASVDEAEIIDQPRCRFGLNDFICACACVA